MKLKPTRPQSNRTARLDVRLNAQAKEKIEQAAIACHQTVTDFVVSTLLCASEDALARHHTMHLTNRDGDLFLAGLDQEQEKDEASIVRLEELFTSP